jgi:hypothetical protein
LRKIRNIGKLNLNPPIPGVPRFPLNAAAFGQEIQDQNDDSEGENEQGKRHGLSR